MNPFHFGSADRALFGIHQPPMIRGGGRRGVVLCPPFGVEYMRSHRAYRQLTTLLGRKGFHVLRFDWFGTGDSMGTGEDASLEGWTSDAGSAITELLDLAGLDRVSVVGLRLGAPLALRAVAGRTDVERLVLWDPVTSGAAWLGEVLPGDARHPREFRGTVGVSGFPLTEGFRGEVATLEAEALPVDQGRAVEVVVSGEDPRARALADDLRARGGEARFHMVPSEGNWAEGDTFGSALLPQGIIQTIVELLASGRAGTPNDTGTPKDAGAAGDSRMPAGAGTEGGAP